MNALRAFTSYLAQAHGCSAIAVLDELPPDPSARERLDLARTLVTCHVEHPGIRARERLVAFRSALGAASAGVAVLETGVPRREALDVARAALAERTLAPAFLGHAPESAGGAGRGAVVAVFDPTAASWTRLAPPPNDFRVVAIVPARNEEDVIVKTLRDLVGQGLEVLLLDDASTDATVRLAEPFLGHGLLAIDRAREPSRTYDLRALLGRVEDAAERLAAASWIVLHDADERRRSPWPGVSLRDALWRVDRSGFTCVDHVTLAFWPTDDAGFDPAGPDLEARFPCFEFSRHPGHFHQRRAWKHPGCPVGLRRSAGHDVDLPGRRVYPYKFLLKHYPIRSQAHGEAKLRERRERMSAEERSLGWHRQYDDLGPPRHVRDPATLRRFDGATFHADHLVERLSGAGVFDVPPPWATPPCW